MSTELTLSLEQSSPIFPRLVLPSEERTPLGLDLAELHPTIDIAQILSESPSIDYLADRAYAEVLKTFPGILELLQAAGVHPKLSEPVINPYTQQLDTEDWTNVGEHNLVVGEGSVIITAPLVAAGILGEEYLTLARVLGTLHDYNKRYEKFEQVARAEAAKRGEVFVPLTQEQYVERGVDPQVAKWYFEYDNPTGGEAIPKFLRVLPSGEVRSCQQDIMDLVMAGRTPEAATDLIRTIVATVDNMTYSEIAHAPGEKARSFFLTSWERLQACSQRRWYPSMWEKGLGVKDQEIVWVDDVSKLEAGVKLIGTFAALQVYVSAATAQIVKTLIDPTSPKAPEQFVKSLLNSVQ